MIGAMGGEQSLDRMGGFRKALPFTYGCFIIGGLALSGVPPFSGFFSKDEILLVTGERGGWHWALYVAGYVGAFLTAIYTFRMIFRAFHGEPVAGGARARRRPPAPRRGADATRPTARWRTPTSASPARRTRSPSARCRCASRWACSRVGAVGAGLVADPEGRLRDRRLPARRRSPTRRSYEPHTKNGAARRSAWSSARVLGAGRASRSPTASGCARPGTAAAIRARAAPAVRRCSSTSGTSTS